MTDLDVRRPDRLPYALGDRYRTGSGRVVLTGVQAIARGLVEQHERDTRAGLRIATFVSGYQGSPLGGVDRMLAAMPDVLTEHDITFVPGLNEELAATSVWGSQADLATMPAMSGGRPTHDGVVGVWYGKGPGLDRATDALRHANMYGANPRGGMLLLVGDDPASKSSTVPAVSERSLAALGIPVLFPRNAREIVTMTMHGVALSRASGCVVALKIVADVADGAWSFDSHDADVEITVPEVLWEGKPFAYRQRPMAAPAASLDAEADLYGPRTEVVRAYGAANHLDVIDIDPPDATIGIAATGTTFDSVRQALADLGADDFALRHAGVRLLRIGMPTPLGPDTVTAFARGLDEILVVEDKTAFVETQIREILYGRAGAPRIAGKKDGAGRPLIPAGGELTAGRLLVPLRRVLEDRLELAKPPPPALSLEVLPAQRAAYFCSGCPHNRSTAVPDGSLAGGGIGCHTMVTMSGRKDSAVTGLTQMGGEGTQWIGQAPFTDVPHLFQNIGDGTFFHSGQLAVQACVAAGVNITYKLLWNEVVAMTGAQNAEGALTVAQVTHKLAAEGVREIIVCADDPKRHNKRALAKGTLLWHRDRLDEAQRRLRDVAGVTVLIYDQHCAADARRQRKRGTLPVRTTRVLINEAVCEGCGDCGVKSNCLSVQPVETEFGRKTRIDQTSCNTDYSCLDGDCPSFVTVEVQSGKPPRRRHAPEPPAVPDVACEPGAATRNVLFAGIGGTGIVTVNQVLATAALRAGYDVESLDQTGLSQKAGPVVSHLRFAAGELDPANRLTPGSADCIVAFDLLVAADRRNLGYGDPANTVAVASTSKTPTGEMVYDKTIAYPETSYLLNRLGQVSHSVHSLDALAAAQALFGDSTAANFLLIGAAYQTGALGIPAWSIEEAIGINGVAVEANTAAFRWGRVAIADPAHFHDVVSPVRVREPAALPRRVLDGATFAGRVGDLIARRAADLVGFQNEAVARRYVTVLQSIWTAERAVGDRTEFSEAVAKGLYKLTAYKDEYEVARLLSDPQFRSFVQSEVPGAEKLTYRLHPPALRAMGWKKKIGLGPRSHIALRILAQGKRLRGTRFDPFGYSRVRRTERDLIAEYITIVTRLAAGLDQAGYDRAVEIAALADMVRGYEGIKLASVEAYHGKLRELGAL
ncbi:indolepyruvate ferredoxin oxidoreductase family protein [Mycolicibacterium pyrenivorans]|uniref:indolepyruvate ferredoxin oxidoreductase family protein n=1 Tax=Mycolicibacterium pyrenivorans TaxID=187102 RepID=UPI0021F28B37|nr:indolepyruvate ferredoxin oxidoreductase family protein [Mycolicibacterium pyrenivorans]MCV7151350.1 indolepyruvate ferredoxin oxidoreductase family protein [Mycolicibacterium pyrenivorans]